MHRSIVVEDISPTVTQSPARPYEAAASSRRYPTTVSPSVYIKRQSVPAGAGGSSHGLPIRLITSKRNPRTPFPCQKSTTSAIS